MDWYKLFIIYFLGIGFSICHAEFKPYTGLAYQFRSTVAKDDWRQLLPQAFHHGAIFLGNRFNKYYSVELAYYNKLHKSHKISSTSAFFGNVVTADLTSEVHVAMYRKGSYLDMNIYHQLDPFFTVAVILGLGLEKNYLAIKSPHATILTAALRGVSGKKYFYGRVGLGAEYLEKRIGFRLRVMWESSTLMRLNVDSMLSSYPNTSDEAFKNGYLASFGVFYQF